MILEAIVLMLGLADKPKSKDESKKKAGEPQGSSREIAEVREVDKTIVAGPPYRFVLHLLYYLNPLLASNEKPVRYRTSQLLSLLLSNTLQDFPFDYSQVSNGIFVKLRVSLAKRMKDKEAVVRVQAAIGVIRLMEMGVDGNPSDDEDEDEAESSTGNDSLFLLIDSMQNDPSS